MEKLKIIRGSETRADEVKKQLLEWGASEAEINEFGCGNPDYCYYVDDNGAVRLTATDGFFIRYLNCEIVELPEKKQPEYRFKPFEKVLGRDYESNEWRADFFSHMGSDGDEPIFVCIGYSCYQCIPYEGNEHLLGTTDSPKKGGE